MKTSMSRALLLVLLAPACDQPSAEMPATSQQAVRDRTIKIGVLVDDASPAKVNFTAAATLAERQINEGLAAAHSDRTVDVIVGYYGGSTMKTQAARTIELASAEGIHGIVSDVSGVAGGAGGTVAVNRLNYTTPSPIPHRLPVTCYQCSSAFFNDPAQTDPGFADPDNWLARTFFNATFESAVQVQLVFNRPAFGDASGDGHTKIVVYYDAGHQSAATTMPGLTSAIFGARSHSVELILKDFSPTADRPAELAKIFDGHNETTGADDGPPDAVYLAFLPANIPQALGDYTTHPAPAKPPATANNGGRRDFLLPTLLANGGDGLEGNSVLVAADSRSGDAFLASYRAASGDASPELTASYLYDAIAAQALAGLIAAEDCLTPERMRDALGEISNARGKVVGATPAGFREAERLIRRGRAINYDGAASPLDLTATGETYPDLVHWKIQGGQFLELESYRCDPLHPNCVVRP